MIASARVRLCEPKVPVANAASGALRTGPSVHSPAPLDFGVLATRRRLEIFARWAATLVIEVHRWPVSLFMEVFEVSSPFNLIM